MDEWRTPKQSPNQVRRHQLQTPEDVHCDPPVPNELVNPPRRWDAASHSDDNAMMTRCVDVEWDHSILAADDCVHRCHPPRMPADPTDDQRSCTSAEVDYWTAPLCRRIQNAQHRRQSTQSTVPTTKYTFNNGKHNKHEPKCTSLKQSQFCHESHQCYIEYCYVITTVWFLFICCQFAVGSHIIFKQVTFMKRELVTIQKSNRCSTLIIRRPHPCDYKKICGRDGWNNLQPHNSKLTVEQNG